VSFLIGIQSDSEAPGAGGLGPPLGCKRRSTSRRLRSAAVGSSTGQVGLAVPAGERRWRVGVGFRDGRVPIGEFFQVEEGLLLLG
jgi:hypothetical protein